MVLQKQLTESAHVYDNGGDYLYRVKWAHDRGYSLYRRKRPTDPRHKYDLWNTNRSEVESYNLSQEFSPTPQARPMEVFVTLFAVEKVIERFEKNGG